ncbi:MAG: hypothetical protein HY710_02670 [Candidatus Latescibacteria bacterium]|nr:hypothetical protein [Candidatus Latescibacterota bacterium]
MTGVEIAWRTLQREHVEEPCLICCWVMKREFFRQYAGVDDIYADPVRTAVEAFANSGCNLNPQFIMPSPHHEHLACDPFHVPESASGNVSLSYPRTDVTPEQVRDDIEALPDPETLGRDFDLDAAARNYAQRLLRLREMSGDRTLYIGSFGMPSFMGGYTRWNYESYLSALYLYPEHFRRYFWHGGEWGRLYNLAIAEAVRQDDLAPVVYGGDDICFNDGPMCAVAMLDNLYFPALADALRPLVEAGIEIVWHCDGNVLPLVPRLIDLGVTGFQGFQEREANIPLEEMVQFRRQDGGKLIFFGSVSVVHTLPFGTVEDVKREVERCFQVAAPGGGFCLAPSSSILPEAPLENIRAMMEHGREYGRRFLAGEV